MDVRHHLLIAGTGRAGTSFLVRVLHELGFDTQIGRRGDQAHWDEDANAGYEDHVLWKSDSLPYVAKFPWLFQTIDTVLADRSVAIDGVIIPMRDLEDAASSRIVTELRNRHAHLPPMQSESRVWGHWASTPGGVIYSLDPVDEARILAAGFHRLVERLVAADVPIHLLAFPRMINDAERLVRGLRSCLPPTVSDDQVRQAHAKVADAAKVRIGPQNSWPDDPSLAELDRQALGREVTRLRAELAALRVRLAEAEAVS